MSKEKAKYDLIGALYESEVMQMLDLHRVESLEEKIAWDRLIDDLTGRVGEKRANEIGELINIYANASSETGFKSGFHMAMRICMEGLHTWRN